MPVRLHFMGVSKKLLTIVVQTVLVVCTFMRALLYPAHPLFRDFSNSQVSLIAPAKLILS